MQKIANFIGGEFVAPQSDQYFDNFDPATGQPYSLVPHSNALDVVKAIQSASKAFEKWQKTTAQERSQILLKIADGIESRLEEFAAAESKDVGKPLWLAREVDIPRAVHNFRFFATAILHHEEMATDMDGSAINYSLRQPLGVAALISPWNLPLYLLTWKIAPALACGNVAICKPSEVTPMTAFMLGEVFQDAGLPEGVCNVVHGYGPDVGAPLVEHPGVPLVSFTGGTSTGEAIQKLAAPQFKKVSLELGGKNANIIFKDADMKKAIATSVQSSFRNQGEICLCGSRIFIHESVYDQFVDGFVAEVNKLKVGDPSETDTFMGPVVSKAHYEKVLACIEQAKTEQGKILTGGERPSELPDAMKDGYFIKPTVIGDLSDCSELQQKEIFGPVVTLRPFKYAHEAIRWANTTPYGLSATIWSQDITRAHKTAAQLDVGTVWINTWMKRDLRVPFGGFKASGLGREGGKHSIDFYTEQKNVCVQL